MKLRQVFEDTPARIFDDFGEWSAAAKEAGAVKTMKTTDGSRLYAVDHENKPVRHAYGYWDEREKQGIIFVFRRKLTNTELGLEL